MILILWIVSPLIARVPECYHESLSNDLASDLHCNRVAGDIGFHDLAWINFEF